MPGKPMHLVYRIQLNRDFPLCEAGRYLPYLKKLGVSHVYLSPILKAVSGSNHCYDVTDFSQVNPELGGEEAFGEFCWSCSSLGLGIILDVVPNHMAYSLENPYVEAAFIDGTGEFRRIFDTFSNPFSPGESVVFPFLSRSTASLVSQHLVRITPGPMPVIHIDSLDIPLRKMPEMLADSIPKRDTGEEDAEDGGALPDVEISSMEVLEEIIRDIPLRPVFWQYSSRCINYRRFFAVNGLIAVRSQDMDVLRLTHGKIIDLARNSCVTGIRIDHLDGLYDPASYVEFLRESLPGKNILAEKVLIPGESLPESLRIDGTTGYDYLGMLNALYADPAGYGKLRDRFCSRAHGYSDVHEVLQSYKRDFIREEFSGDLDNLSWPFYDSLVLKHFYEFSYHEIRKAVEGILISFDKYRTYSRETDTREIAMHLLTASGGDDHSISHILSEHVSLGCRHCTGPVLSLQQFSGALMAKNLEDRLFFSYNPLIFLNEVGWSPEATIPGWSDFLDFIVIRKGLPGSLNEASTHDTKYGEDLRSSGLVISEYPDLFLGILDDLESRATTAFAAGRLAVEHLYYIAQLIMASHGMSNHYTDYRKEIGLQITKAMRESMVFTSWKNPDTEYENAALKFAGLMTDLLDSREWAIGLELEEKCREIGHYNSISMLVLRFMLPGVPSLYQGSEYVNVHFTDPDNREKVDFNRYQEELASVSQLGLQRIRASDFPALKLKLITVLSGIRRELADVIENGDLEIMQVTGPHASSVLSYYIRRGKEILVVVALRNFSRLVDDSNRLDRSRLEGDSITVPDPIRGSYVHMLTGNTINIWSRISVADVVGCMPVAVLRKVE
jgi:(1->4)-alpha-D-glucan 1-alpha-D-glucosylmutase